MPVAPLPSGCTVATFDSRNSTLAAIASGPTGTAFTTESTFDGVVCNFGIQNRHSTATVVVAAAFGHAAFSTGTTSTTTTAGIR